MPHYNRPWPSWLWRNKDSEEGMFMPITTVRSALNPHSELLPDSMHRDNLGLQVCSGQCSDGLCSMEKTHCITDVGAGDRRASAHYHPFYLTTEKQMADNETDDAPSHRPRISTKSLCSLLMPFSVVCIALVFVLCINVLNSTPIRPATSYSELFLPTNDPHLSQQSDSEQDLDPLTASKPSRKPPKLPPPAKRIPHPLTLYNETLIDHYRWMHQIDQDPDVQAYINAESEYTASWIRQSGIATLQGQLESEMAQIRDAIARLPLITEGQYTTNGRSEERLEGTKFWDLDRWRYWLDESVGPYGVYKRRFLPRRSSYQWPTEKVAGSQLVLSLSTTRKTVEDTHADTGQGCSAEPVAFSTVQVVLDVNQLAEKRSRKGDGNQITMGSVEIQPKSTFLAHADTQSIRKKPKNKGTYVAYTYDVSGDERFFLQILLLPSEEKLQREPANTNMNSDCDPPCKPSNDDHLEGHFKPFKGTVVRDAGPDTRWAKLGSSLYLYFTRLDPKGLSREVWRIKVDDLSNDGDGDEERKNELELVMREDDERNVLSISTTNDGRFLLIESAGQTTSHTYFMSMDSPEHGWKLIRAAEEDVKYKVEHHTDYFYLLINHGDASNFKVLRAPVHFSQRNPGTSDDSPPGVLTESLDQDKRSLLGSLEDEIVIEHDPKEYIQRFSVFVRHFVAWIWRDGLQEIRVYAAPRPGDITLPLKEVQRIRPYNEDVKVAAVMPSNTRSHDQRLFMDFYSTKLWYSNCSYVHPWAIYEVDMDLITPSPVEWSQGNEMRKSDDKDERLRNSTSLVCQDPFPLGVRYGRSLHQQSFDLPITDIKTIKDPKKKQKQAIAKFREQLLMVPSRHNGILIPVSLVYHVLPSDKQFPRRAAFVKAYGAYGTMTTPDFDPQVFLPLLHRGLLFVHIHPRGDGNLGPQWYANGKAERKLNTFYDVEDVLLYLRDSGMVEKEGIVIEGRSAGGLVSGWIANRWGETSIRQLFSDSWSGSGDGSSVEDLSPMNDGGSKSIVREMVRAVLAQVPFLDVIADMSDPDIPWVEYEWVEWGSPLQSREVYEVMKAYSPYDRIRNQHYPAMMVMGGLADGRVSYAEPLKFVAKLRSVDGKTNDCQPVHDKGGKDSEEGSQDDVLDGDLKGKRRWNKGIAKMCAGKKDTPLLLQMENGGHFSGNSSLWMAFGLYHLAAEDVITV
ncbi:hypothetical protein BGX34_002300 [Mortierella sp. NVP85]|nr:hypothetical protein BGX34_002300 [Mortierella sp. NVP85]